MGKQPHGARMGSFSSWSYAQRVTLWPVTTDEFSQPVTGTPFTVNGSFKGGGRASRDDQGNEFIPNATFWYEGTDEQAPKIQWYVALGEHTGSPPATAELIRRVIPYEVELFQAGSLRDYQVMT